MYILSESRCARKGRPAWERCSFESLKGKRGSINIYLLAALTTQCIKRVLRDLLRTSETKKSMTTFNTSREIPATVEQVFAAISDPERLARMVGTSRIHQYV